ncbi:glycine/D-amino acid oxidase-like deaminating enzyme [Glaciihabitans tibetensis]|uniref:Glycine/D-amino acid oxidase-like deaminating enzyme n=1 Tax=Glaciihabitans tibetensis TaxID=1266600 RepID=A0A2T0V6R8_9MICO|nr:FAD-binding oxidoreductase [Glaciihabitans tibetensis]PRY65870.1 glycine/D-amino acid oxidase-like deaminating enzyme [Glaciihabitans tibetensis]
MKIAIIGAGVVGMSVAAELGQRGHSVVVLEANGLGSGTSSTSFAWINSNGKSPRPYFDLNYLALQKMTERGTGSDWFIPSGHVEWANTTGHKADLRARVARLQGYGYPAEWVTPDEARRVGPGLKLADDADTIAWFPTEGYVYPSLMLVELNRRALASNVTTHYSSNVVGIDSSASGATVSTAAGGQYDVDLVVSCVGRWTGELSALVGHRVPMVSTTEVGGAGVGYLATTAPIAVDYRPLLSASELNVRPAGGGRFLLQSTVLDADADSTAVVGLGHPVARELRDRFAAMFTNGEGAAIESFVVGQRAMPADGWPVVGQVDPSVPFYAVATHSGVTLSLALGTWVADEIEGARVALLDTFRPARLFDPAATFVAPVPRLPGEQ